MSTQVENYVTIILSPIAAVTAYIGITLTDIDLMLAITLKAMSIISIVLIIAVNWKKGMEQIKEWIKIK